MIRTNKILAALGCLLYILSSYSQTNLVPNPSFETYTACPIGTDQMNYCSGWSAYNQSPDYFNTCSTTPGMAPPNCGFGFQWPNSGNAYAGLTTFVGTNSNYREIIGSALTSTLVIGQKYFLSFFINMAGKVYKKASDKMGVRFSTIPFSTLTPVPINNFSHYFSSSIVTDTTNWVKLKGSFTADSAYKYIMLGNFYTDINTNTLSIGTGANGTYYYIDDVCVSTDSTFTETWTNLKENKASLNSINIYPNPASESLFINFSEAGLTKVRIYTAFGKLVYERSNFSIEKEIIIDLMELNAGFYNLFLETGNYVENKKIIITKQ